MTQADPTSITDRLGRLVTDSGQGLPRRGAGAPASRREPAARAGSGEGPSASLPNRYEIREIEDGQVLLCDEAPGVAVSLDRRYGFTEAEARKLGERVVLVDGAGQFGPVIDDAGHLYNIDHHQGCLRAFTLSSCEQSLLLVLKGLQLDKGDWSIYANEPDLDTLFALWVLLNYRRVRQLTPEQRDAIVPLLRLEGAIDANGLEIAEYCGLPREVLETEKERLDRLHRVELEAKRAGDWSEMDLYEYTREMLLAIDHMVFESTDFHDYTSVEEVYGHVDIGADHVAVVCRDGSGIYEVEKRLKQVWGDRLGLIALEREPAQYTLRRTASLAGIVLGDAYDRLNLLDPVVDGRPPEKRWGGSDDIGGSPRPDGTGLTPREIGKILKLTYKKVAPLQQLQRLGGAALWVLGLALGAGLSVFAWRLFGPETTPAITAAVEVSLAAAFLGLGAWILTRRLSRGWTWLFGWRLPAGEDWLALVPAVLVAAVVGGAWIPRAVSTDAGPLAAAVGSTVLAALALELAFRGLMHGLLILDHPVQEVRGRWFVSRPTLASALLYALVTAVATQLWLAAPPVAAHPTLTAAVHWGLPAAGALVAGLALGMIRERSLSVWPGFAALALGGVARLLLEIWRGI